MRSWLEIERSLARRWNEVLREILAGHAVFPLRVPLAPPRGNALAENFAEIRLWIRELRENARTFECLLEEGEVRSRALGKQRVPRILEIPSFEAFARIVDREARAEAFKQAFRTSLNSVPAALPAMTQNVGLVEAHAPAWGKIVSCAQALASKEQRGIFARQWSLPDVDTKFLERHYPAVELVLNALRALPEEDASDKETGFKGFCRRRGLFHDEPLIRFRWLDPMLNRITSGLRDVSTPVSEFARFAPPVDRVFIVENKVSGLTFPEVSGAMVAFGLGAAVELLGEVPWLRGKDVFYWGDIDTHGLVILGRLLRKLPWMRPFAMDETTLLAMKEWWTTDGGQELEEDVSDSLAGEQLRLLENLRRDAYGTEVRLEQERVPVEWVRQELSKFGVVSEQGG